MQLNIISEVWKKKKKWFVVRCPELNVASQGKTRNEAENNLLKVCYFLRLHLCDMGRWKTVRKTLAADCLIMLK